MKTVCYCFGYTEHQIRQEVLDTGTSNILINIETAYNLDICSCKIAHPDKRCCLPEVKVIVENAMLERFDIMREALTTLQKHGVDTERLKQRIRELLNL